MGEQESINASVFINEELQEQVKKIMEKIEKNIVLKAILGKNKASLEMEQFLRQFENFSSHLRVEIYNTDACEVVNKDLNSEMFPVVGIYDEQGNYQRTAFYGVPTGKEMNTFVMAICYIAGLGKELDDKTIKRIGKIKKSTKIEVIVSPACHHCAQMGMYCQRIASLNNNITCEIINGFIYPEIVSKYNVQKIPLTIINEEIKILGVKEIDNIVLEIR